jgi:hypothetical protein
MPLELHNLGLVRVPRFFERLSFLAKQQNLKTNLLPDAWLQTKVIKRCLLSNPIKSYLKSPIKSCHP